MAAAPVDIVHLAYTDFPADTRVKREALVALATGRRVAVVALQMPGQPIEEERDGLLVLRVPGHRSRGSAIAYITEYGEFTWRCRRLLGSEPRLAGVKIVHIHTLPDFLTLAAAPARRRGARIILDLHEIFPEFAASKYGGALGRMAAIAALRIERWARTSADVTITVNKPIDDLLATRSIPRAERRLIIHNSTDPFDFGPSRAPTKRASKPGLELVYHGTLTALYGLDIAIRGVTQAASGGVPVHLTIIGDGPQRHSLLEMVRTFNAQSLVTFERPIAQSELPGRLTACDAGLVPTQLNQMTRYSLSNKLLDYVHLGLPLLASRLPSYEHYLSDDAAWYWTPNDGADLARTIAAFATSSPSERAARARRAQDCLDQIAWPRERERLLALYQELLAST